MIALRCPYFDLDEVCGQCFVCATNVLMMKNLMCDSQPCLMHIIGNTDCFVDYDETDTLVMMSFCSLHFRSNTDEQMLHLED